MNWELHMAQMPLKSVQLVDGQAIKELQAISKQDALLTTYY
jgi:hypothetical protein